MKTEIAVLDTEGQAYRRELIGLFGRGIAAAIPEEEFNRIALRLFDYQFRKNEPYAAYCRRRGRLPDTITHWTEIPAVPTSAFKEVALLTGRVEDAEATFRTSGTTRGYERRGEHHVLDLSLYHTSLLPTFAAYVLPDGAELPMLSLLPPAEEMPDSSLVHMVDVVSDRLGATGSGSFATVDGGIDEDRLETTLRRYEEEGTPVCLLGTSLSFVHWLDGLRERGTRFRLPPGSRLMDTGGFKGRSREVAAEEMREAYATLLGIDEEYVINEYGMTEMCSQFYDNVLRDRTLHGSARPRRKVGPPWVRTQAVDPETLEPLPAGEVGILRHFDLANLGSVIAIQTEDLGREVDGGGFILLGRATGAQPRGCSIAMDLLLGAVGDRGR